MIRRILDSILDPVQPVLSPDVFDSSGMMIPHVREYLMKDFDEWLTGVNGSIPVPPFTQMFLLGSMAGYQYTDDSDIDVNVVMPLEEETLKKLLVNLPNGRPLPGTNHPVNYYISPIIRGCPSAVTVYDILNNVWVVLPEQEEIGYSIVRMYRVVQEVARFFMAGIDIVVSEYYADVDALENYRKNGADSFYTDMKTEEVSADYDSVLVAKHVVKALRREAFSDESRPINVTSEIDIRTGNWSINNLIYKYLERTGYLSKMEEVLDRIEEVPNVKETEMATEVAGS
jgi:hypothetical protein